MIKQIGNAPKQTESGWPPHPTVENAVHTSTGRGTSDPDSSKPTRSAFLDRLALIIEEFAEMSESFQGRPEKTS